MAVINGNARNNNLRGTNDADTINGNGGNDLLQGLGGADTLDGGTGADVFVGGSGADTFVGGFGEGDTVDYGREGGGRGVTVNLSGERRAGLAPDTARDTFGFIDAVPNVPNVIGTRFADTIVGGGSNNRLAGGAGNDLIVGRRGDDLLTGGLGRDTLFGGEDADTFDFNAVRESGRGAGADLLEDFQTGADTIDLSTIDANAAAAGNQAFAFLGAGAFTGDAGQLRFAGGVLQGDVNGDGAADFEIRVAGTVARGDLIL